MRSRVDEDLQECVCVHVRHMAILKTVFQRKKDNEHKDLNTKESNGLY